MQSEYGQSVAQRILWALRGKLENLQDNGKAVFRAVHWGDLENLDNQRLPVAGIDRGTEEKIDMANGCTEYNMPVFFHFRFRGQYGLDELDAYQYYLALVQMAVLADHNLGGLTMNIEEETNAHTIVGIEDTYPGGTLATMVTYRTRLHNPYKLITEKP